MWTKNYLGKQHGTVTEAITVFYKHWHLHLVILQTLLSKATYNWGIHKAIKQCPSHQVLGIVQIKYKLAREGEEGKEKDEGIKKGKYFIFLVL